MVNIHTLSNHAKETINNVYLSQTKGTREHLDDFGKNLRFQIKLHDDICTSNDSTVTRHWIQKHNRHVCQDEYDHLYTTVDELP